VSAILELVRADLRDFAGYRSARSERVTGDVWLNANESAWPNLADAGASARRYPEPQPPKLRTALAELYAVAPEQLLIGRGSDEAIDLLVRALCTPGRDAVIVTPPVFGMYAVCAHLHGARVIEVPLRDADDDFRVNLDAVAQRALTTAAKIVFLCSPGNPAGGVLPVDDVLRLARQLDGRAMVVVDEAYIEFADAPSLVGEAARQSNLAILRTLSKAHALAAARIGCVIADSQLIEVLRRCQAPYPIPAPCAELALAALGAQARATTRRHIDSIKRERERMYTQLSAVRQVRRVYPSQGNFLLVRFDDAAAAFQTLLSAGVVVRDQRAAPQLQDALRISIGTPEQNARVLAALRVAETVT
jgi:histidinol-phosphate aminotransferase